ncbi:MAG: cell division protein ZapB [Candidatus Krumholzibacteria bacterium]|nr:cell division protein ZapB [Candidatus Krumholzibacteria bacterium]
MAGSGIINLDMLEEKITKAAEHIARLKEENSRLERINKELKEKFDSLYIKNEELTRELEILRTEGQQRGDFDKTREEIKGKVEEMLAKLDQLDI